MYLYRYIHAYLYVIHSLTCQATQLFQRCMRESGRAWYTKSCVWHNKSGWKGSQQKQARSKLSVHHGCSNTPFTKNLKDHTMLGWILWSLTTDLLWMGALRNLVTLTHPLEIKVSLWGYITHMISHTRPSSFSHVQHWKAGSGLVCKAMLSTLIVQYCSIPFSGWLTHLPYSRLTFLVVLLKYRDHWLAQWS